jgi:DNA-binding response OmpR family regulator
LETDLADAPSILVIEDNYFAGLMIENALTDAGFNVQAVLESGEAALQAAMARRPALVVMDIRLAGELDGLETACLLGPSGVPVLFATAHSDPAMKARATGARTVGWLVKPYTEDELVKAIRGVLSSQPEQY